MREGVGRDQRLKGRGADVVDKGDFLVFEVDSEHIVNDVEERETI